MRESITQEQGYGCGIACFAFVCNLTYKEAEKFLGPEQANSDRFIVKDLRNQLNRFGKNYKALHVKPNKRIRYTEGMIVLIRRSKKYPVGHYLVRHNGYWMDPWINIKQDKSIKNASSGYRKKLPGQPMYALFEV